MTEIKTLPFYPLFDTVETIIHISDVHIRLFKRQEEYLKVFENLYAELRQRQNDKTLVVLAGDIIHSKTEMSPEMVRMTFDFLSRVTQLFPTILIPGNHDANLNNMDRLDGLSPITSNLKLVNLAYIKNSGLYQAGNVVFSVMSIFDTKPRYIPASEIPDEFVKVALYHGPVNKSITDAGYVVSNGNMEIEDFHDFDMAILGDIHKKQTLSKYDRQDKTPTCAYGGSLVQQNHGESTDGHGFLVWDVNSRTHEFVPVVNDYGFATIDIDGGKIVSEPNHPPKHPRLRVRIANTTSSQLKECLVDIRKRYNPVEVSTNKSATSLVRDDLQRKMDLSNIRDVNFQNELLKDYLERNVNGVTDELLSKVYDINLEANKALPMTEVARNVIWKPKTFEYSNMFSYGENNFIDFTKLKGMAGLFAANASGKSSVLDALAFFLFDKCSKSTMAGHIMNSRKKEFWGKLNIEIDGVDYFIEKTAVKKKIGDDTASVKINFYKIVNGEKESLNGEDRSKTREVIRKYVGEYEDFALTALSFQDGYKSNFIAISQSDRKSLLIQFLDLGIYELLEKLVSEDIKEYTVLLKKLAERNFDSELAEIYKMAEIYANDKTMLGIAKTGYIKARDVHNADILELTKNIAPIGNVNSDIYGLEKSKDTLETRIKNGASRMKDIKEDISRNGNAAIEVKKRVDELKSQGVKDKYEELKRARTDQEKIQLQVSRLKVELQGYVDRNSKLKTLEYDLNCSRCVENMKKIDVEYMITAKKIDDCMDSARDLKKRHEELQIVIDSLVPVEVLYDELTAAESEFEQSHLKHLQFNATYSNEENKKLLYENELASIQTAIDAYYKNKVAIESNEALEIKIREIKVKLKEILKELGDIESKELNVKSKILFYEDKKKETLSDMEYFKEIEKKVQAGKLYLQAVKKDGIPYELIAKCIPALETEVNNILNQVTDFSVSLELEGKDVDMIISYDTDRHYHAELGSGMEKFIVGLALRVALINISTLPRPNFIAIDEGFTSLDADNSANIPTVFDYIRHHFDFALVISHLEVMRDFVDVILDLKKVDGYSKIVFK